MQTNITTKQYGKALARMYEQSLLALIQQCMIWILTFIGLLSYSGIELPAQQFRTQGPLISTFSNGGVIVTPTGSVRMRGVIGQPLIGRYASGSLNSGAGFFQAAGGITTNLQQTNALSIDRTTISVISGGGTSSVSVTSNVSWSVSSNQSWCTVSPPYGSNNGTFTIN
jgi:hypothetical protein